MAEGRRRDAWGRLSWLCLIVRSPHVAKRESIGQFNLYEKSIAPAGKRLSARDVFEQMTGDEVED